MKAFIQKHKKLSIFLLILLALLIPCTVSAVSDYRKLSNIKGEIANLESQLHEKGGIGQDNTTYRESCGRPERKFSPRGQMTCSVALDIKVENIKLAEAQEYFEAFKSTVEHSPNISARWALPNTLEKKHEHSELIFNSAGYEMFGRNCGINYKFSQKESRFSKAITDETEAILTMSIGCDSTSWFVRNVLNHTVYLF